MTMNNDNKTDNEVSEKKKPSMIISVISNWLALIINLLIGFVLTPLIIKNLGVKNYGIWSLVSMLVGYYGFLDLGITNASVRYLSRYVGLKDKINLNKVASSSLFLFSCIGLLIVIASIFIPEPLAVFFKVKPNEYDAFKLLLYLMGITAGLTIPAKLFSSVIIAHENWVVMNIIQVLTSLIRGGFALYVLYIGEGLVGLGVVYASVGLLSLICFFIVSKLKYKEVKYKIKYISKKTIILLFTFGGISILTQFGDLLRFNMDSVVIGKVLDLKFVGIYSVAALLMKYVSFVSNATTGVTLPRLALLAGTLSKQEFSKEFLKYGKILSAFVAGFGVLAFVMVDDFLILWLPDDFEHVQLVSTVLRILVIGNITDLMTGISINALQAFKRHALYAWQSIVEGIFNLILSLILVKYYGLIGIALGTMIPCLVTRLFIQPVFSSRVANVKLTTYIINLLVKPLLVASFTVFVCLKINSILEVKDVSYIYLFVKAGIVFILYNLLVFVFCFDKSIRSFLLEKFGSKLNKKIRRG